MDAGYIAALSGLAGALIGSASSIATMIIQSRVKDRRDRSKQVTDLALAEYRTHVDLATSGKGPPKVMPISTYIFSSTLILDAIESGTFTPAKMQEFWMLNDEFFETAMKLDEERLADLRKRQPGQTG